ncbi:hypothetical protein Ga0123461_1757 [Mariprofundus aestuarium]|uniref:Integrase n=1 Tax=Mariprofundus aestuarium TaxID=1921086 RepID=A0A2K8KYS8_MARES|nr:hypothetical protein [Mariprofundus aestuarium]ATX80170.1 hypothetical protein Ga0123461_1757 [Mariprofundus aestuarium]
MDDNVLIFTPKFERDAIRNLNDFISFAESLPPLNQEMDYASAYWKGAANFTKMGVSSRNRGPENILDGSIVPFAKAYLIYSQTLNPAKTLNEMKALRAIEKVMVRAHGKVDICTLNSTMLDQAAQEIRESYSTQAAYHGGIHLEKLQRFLVVKKIIKSFTWLNPIKRGEDTIEKVGKKGVENRNKKLPDENGLQALAEMFALGEEHLAPRDIFTTSAMAILMAAPARASELFYLKEDCLHEDVDRNGNKALGIKWYSGKGYGHEVEWVPSVMEETVREAVKRLQKLSAGARKFALYLEAGRDSEKLLVGQKLPLPYIKYKRGKDVKVRWSEGLFTLFEHQLSAKIQTKTNKLWMPDINTLNEDLAPTKKKKRGTDELSNVKSVFERYKYPSYKVTSHQMRHLLTTIAKVNGMETELLTKWAGRANEKHNRVYNHTLPEHYNQQYSLIAGREKGSNNLSTIEIIKPETIQEINTSASLTLHQTEFGVCIHDYIISPCSKHRNCVTCTEQVCIKGDEVKVERLKMRLASEQSLLESDKAAMDEGSIGADRHYNKRLETIKYCSELIDRLTDDNLPDGTLIKLSSALDMSHLDKALDINHKKRLPKIEKNRKSGAQPLNRPPHALAKLKMLRGS